MSDDSRSMTESTSNLSATEKLEDHEYVYSVRDVSVDGYTVLNVQFASRVLPQPIRKSERYRVGDIWVGTYPSWCLRRFGGKFAMRYGIGTSAIAAEIWVMDE